MNLFVLPSWYPSAAQPAAGRFVRDQVAALAAARPSRDPGCGDAPAPLRVVVGRWGHHDGALSLRDPAASWSALRWRLRARAGWHEAADGAAGWQEVCTPRLTWTLALARGGAAGLLRASRRNLAEARARLGTIDLVHAHVGFPAGWIAARLAAETGVPYVLTEHMGPFPVPQLLAGGQPCAALREAFTRAAATIAVSPALAARIRACGLPCSDIVPNAIDGERFALPGAPPAPPAPFTFLSLCGLTRQKGVDLLLDAFARWNPPADRVRLEIGGDGPERGALERRAAALGLAGRVRFLGRLAPTQVPAAFARCHAFVLASRHESFGVVLAEALASGRPVLATRCGGPEAIVEATDGLLVPPLDVDALAAGLAALRSRAGEFDPARLRASALARFGQAAVARRLRAIYDRVLGR